MPNRFEPEHEADQGSRVKDQAEGAKAEEQSRARAWALRWRSATARWAKETGASYFSNPATRKDFRVQLRGNRSGWLFAIFLLIMGSVALAEYWFIYDRWAGPFGAQQELMTFYWTILGILGAAITFVGPAMVAGSIVAEKQKKSLDLVFTAPVRPRVYLIGKLLAGYRFTWILLALSLPFTAMSVLLGGATWVDVGLAYALLSIQGLVFTAIGLFYSALVERTVSALIYAYATVGAYIFLTCGLGALATDGRGGVQGVGGFPWLMNPMGLISPGQGGIPQVTLVAAVAAAAACLLVVRTCLSAAGAALMPPRPAERAINRLGALGTVAAGTGIVSYIMASNRQIFIGLPPVWPSWVGLCASLILVFFMPFLACYGFDGEHQARPNGPFSLRRILTGTTAGALPFVWLLITSCFAAGGLGAALAGQSLDLSGLLSVYAYAIGFWTFFWAAARFASSFLFGVKAARTLQFLILVAVVVAPVPIFGMMNHDNGNPGSNGWNVWHLWALWPVVYQPEAGVIDKVGLLAYGFGLFISGGIAAWWSEGNLRRRLARKGKNLSDIVRATGDFGL